MPRSSDPRHERQAQRNTNTSGGRMESGQTQAKERREEWESLTDPNNDPSDEDWQRGRELAISHAKDYLRNAGVTGDDYDKQIEELEAAWDAAADDRLERKIRAQEDALIQQQRDIATGRVHGRGTILASEQLQLAGQAAQAGARGLSGRAATRSRLYGRSADDLRLRGAQAVRAIRDQEREQAQANVVQMELAQDKRELVQAREAEAASLQDELLAAEEESNALSVVLGVGGAVVGGVAGFFAGGYNPATAVSGAIGGYGIGASIGANV